MANGVVMVALPTWAALRAWLLHTVFGFLPFRSRLVSNWWFGKATTRREQRAGPLVDGGLQRAARLVHACQQLRRRILNHQSGRGGGRPGISARA